MAVSEEWWDQVNDFSYNKGTNCLVTSESAPKGWFFRHGHTNERHKTHNG